MERILVALDESPRAAQVLDAAISLGRSVGAELTLLRVCPIPTYPYPPSIYSISADLLPQVLEENSRRALLELAERVPQELRGTAYVRLGTPWQQICGLATELDVDLIMIGSHGYNIIDRVLGTTAARVVNHADRSVLVVRVAPEAKAAVKGPTERAPAAAKDPQRTGEAS